MHFETTTGLETWCAIAFVGSLFDSNSQVLTVWHCNRSLVVKQMLLCPDFFILETKFGFPIEWDISLMAPIYYIKFRNSGMWAEKEKNEFFFCISPIAIANFSVGWQTLKYLYDILIPAERTAKKMSTCQKNPELKKIRCKLYIVIWFPETWRELRQAALYFGKKGANS